MTLNWFEWKLFRFCERFDNTYGNSWSLILKKSGVQKIMRTSTLFIRIKTSWAKHFGKFAVTISFQGIKLLVLNCPLTDFMLTSLVYFQSVLSQDCRRTYSTSFPINYSSFKYYQWTFYMYLSPFNVDYSDLYSSNFFIKIRDAI